MKGLAHSYVWWPNIDADLETQVKQCNQCQPSPPAILMHPWDEPEQPWQWINLDYVGSFIGKKGFYCNWCTLQMDGSRGSELCYYWTYCWVSTISVCSILPFQSDGNWQWYVVSPAVSLQDLQDLQNTTKFIISELVRITHQAMAWQRALSKPWSLKWKGSYLIPYKLNCHTFCFSN